MALTLDVWSIPPESARRVGHPAPFPVELPEQLIRLYTFADDLVLDPFMGSGSALVAAARLGRRYVGYDLDASYVEIARRRVAERSSTPVPPTAGATARRQGGAASSPSRSSSDAGFTIDGAQPADPRHRRDRRLRRHRRRRGAVVLRRRRRVHQPPRRAAAHRRRVAVARAGPRPARRAGATSRSCCSPATCPAARATATRRCGPPVRTPSSTPSSCCRTTSLERLRRYAKGGFTDNPQPGFWTLADLQRRRTR